MIVRSLFFIFLFVPFIIVVVPTQFVITRLKLPFWNVIPRLFHRMGCIFLGLRVNVWWSIFAIVLGLVIFFAQKKRHPGLEPSPYMPGRGWSGAPAVVHSQNSESDFVDVSEPPVGKHQVAAKSTAHITK